MFLLLTHRVVVNDPLASVFREYLQLGADDLELLVKLIQSVLAALVSLNDSSDGINAQGALDSLDRTSQAI